MWIDYNGLDYYGFGKTLTDVFSDTMNRLGITPMGVVLTIVVGLTADILLCLYYVRKDSHQIIKEKIYDARNQMSSEVF